ncbi:sodium- and chloride-dependent GABA transporter ine-like isoform X1 [Amblyraja radiata]|uniref:sodium- and chloride-dependent GABA transporter ine-like isoform X1 n=1 Tax=Amblyraja radiata TaxID=386614 RepID=UPI0014027FE6|nr:sodium- and chloride-dependent GABA transporter ine-like isoform X1 [Amblyraja radiata]
MKNNDGSVQMKTRKAKTKYDSTGTSADKVNGLVEVPPRETWSRQIEFLLAGIGYSVGLGNVWRFPFLCYRSGGGAFLIPFFVMLVVLGIPLLYMEIAIGQYFRVGPVKALALMCPLLKGVGVASVAISFIMCTYYNLIICWALYYLINSFQNPLPWHSCNNTWNHPESCTDSHSASNITDSASQQFFDYHVLQKTNGLEDLGDIRWELFGFLALAWVIVYFCIFKGVQWTGKVVYVTALFPYVVLLALLVNNTQLPGAVKGINYFVNPDWEKLKEIQVWVYAAVQVFNSLGIGFGSLIAMASYNKSNHKILNNTLAISLTNTATSILSGFVIFSAFGYMSQVINVPIDKIAVDGPGLVFVIYPEAFVTMPVSPLWAVLFFVMLLFLGLDSQFAMVEVMVTSLMDAHNDHLLKYLKRKEFVVLAVCVAAFLLGIPNVTQGGIYVFQLLDHYTAQVSIVFLAFCEVIAVCCFYGVSRLSQNITEMQGKPPNIYLRVSWQVLSPVLILTLSVFVVLNFEPVRYGSYKYPAWAQGLGWVIALASLVWIPGGALHTLLTLKGPFLKRLSKAITPVVPVHVSIPTEAAALDTSPAVTLRGMSSPLQAEILRSTFV